MFLSNNFMQNLRYKVSSPRIRISRSHQLPVKKSSSGKLPPPKSIITRLLFDKSEKKASVSFLQKDHQQVAVLKITSRRSNSFDRKSKIKLKPISSRRQEQPLSELLKVKQEHKGSSMSLKQDQIGQGDVEELFYRQVRIQQEFKRLAALIQ